ncbi:MAG: hypothetical protein JWO53_489 [Chlamydiia bacterium]|nr:hypothetical protein [Chlamydiia bacterium]
MMNFDRFKIIMSSDVGYDELCAEIFYEGQFVAIVTQEEGLENMRIEIAPSLDKKAWNFKFSEFEKVLNSARTALWEMRKIPD